MQYVTHIKLEKINIKFETNIAINFCTMPAQHGKLGYFILNRLRHRIRI